MPTLIFTPRYSDDTQTLWRAAGQLGWSVERLTSWSIPEHLVENDDPILYAEALFAPMLAEQLGLELLNPAEDFLVALPMCYRKRDIYITTLREAKTILDQKFIKPPNDKSFPAKVYRGSELPEGYDDGMAVLVSEIVNWESEFRCFVEDRHLKTFSIYARNGELQDDNHYQHTNEEEAGLKIFMRTLLSDDSVSLPSATVIDVGVVSNKGWAVIEQNAAWGAGVYGCDGQEVLKVVRGASRRSVRHATE